MKIITFIIVTLIFVIRNPTKSFESASYNYPAHHIQKRSVDLDKIWNDIKSAFPGGDKCIKAKDIEKEIAKVIKKFVNKVMESFDTEVALSETEEAKEQFISLAEEYFKPERIVKDIENKKKVFMDIASKLLNSTTIMKQLVKKQS